MYAIMSWPEPRPTLECTHGLVVSANPKLNLISLKVCVVSWSDLVYPILYDFCLQKCTHQGCNGVVQETGSVRHSPPGLPDSRGQALF